MISINESDVGNPYWLRGSTADGRDSAHIKLAELNNIVAANNKRFIAHIAI
jgi:hypothetical protein